MNRLLLLALLLCNITANAQSYIISSWTRNTTGKTSSYWYNTATSGAPTYTLTATSDSADCVKVAYTTDSVWVYSHGMTDHMGAYSNPGTCIAQSYVHRFPRVPAVATTKIISPKAGQIGLLLNGIVIYGLGDGKSYSGSTVTGNTNTGSGIWNDEVYKGEGVSLDTAFTAHPQQSGAYHSHASPKRYYENYATSVHSPLLGWAFDGYPVYGPYGYSTAMSSSSAVTRMKTGYSLRNITTRTTLPTIPNGGGTASQTGPPVSTTYPIGTYCEDYEWLASNGGDLDAYNGRTCVTPEFPGGTYAYFVTISSTGTPQYPYIIGDYYYGKPVTSDFPSSPGATSTGLSIPASATVYSGGSPLAIRLLGFSGKAQGDLNRLDWSVVSSESFAGTTIERSEDGQHFTAIGDVLPLHSTGVANEAYTFSDEQPAPVAYYRLKMREQSGELTFSAVVVLRQQSRNSFAVYPTIAAQAVYVRLGARQAPITIFVVDGLGRTVLTRAINPAESLTGIDVSSLASGMYLIRTGGGADAEAARFFKQ